MLGAVAGIEPLEYVEWAGTRSAANPESKSPLLKARPRLQTNDPMLKRLQGRTDSLASLPSGTGKTLLAPPGQSDS